MPDLKSVYDFKNVSLKKLLYASYRASYNSQYRSLLKAKDDILKCGKYDEREFNTFLDCIFESETARKYILEELKGYKSLTLEEIIDLFDFPKEIIIRDIFHLMQQGYIEEYYEEVSYNRKGSIKKYRIKEISEGFQENYFKSVSTVYDSNICCECGLCSSVCPVDGIELTKNYLYIDEGKCFKCGLCYNFCPQTFSFQNLHNLIKNSYDTLNHLEGLGYYENIYSARTLKYAIRKVGQDGGIVTSLLFYLLKKKLVDAVMTIKHSKDYWKPEISVIDKPNDVYSVAGTTYVHSPILEMLNEAKRFKRIAIVALPCKIRAISKGGLYPVKIPLFSNIKYKIGLFCMKSFPYENMFKLIKDKLSLVAKEIVKMDINRGRFAITIDSGEEYSIPLNECAPYSSNFCKYCKDLTAELADISIGSIGSDIGWSTIITRTNRTETLVQDAIKQGLIEIRGLIDKNPVQSKIVKVSEKKRENCQPIRIIIS